MPDAIAAQTPTEERFDRLYGLYARRVRAYLAAYLSRTYRPADVSLVDDLSQDAWMLVLTYLPGCRAADDRAFGWLACVVRTAVRAHFRRARVRRETSADLSEEWRLPASRSAEDEYAAVTSLVARIRGELARRTAVAA